VEDDVAAEEVADGDGDEECQIGEPELPQPDAVDHRTLEHRAPVGQGRNRVHGASRTGAEISAINPNCSRFSQLPIRLYSTVTPPAANPSPSTEVIASPATGTTVIGSRLSRVPVSSSMTASTTALVRNVRITFATPFKRATGANPNGVVMCRSKGPHCTSLPMSLDTDE